MKRITPLLMATLPSITLASPILEEVIVTAQKREQALAEVPIAISVISSEQIRQANLDTLSDISSQLANVSTALPNGSILPIFSIRGISMSDYSTNQSSPIGVYLDEVHLGANYTHGLSLFDLDRIEVLRGPQGTLYGKNTTGGAINLVSKKPDFKADGYIRLSAGNYSQQSVDAAYETPLIKDELSVRLAITAEQADGYSENKNPGKKDHSETDRKSARLTFNYEPTDNFSAVLRVNTGKSDPITPAVIPRATGPGGLDALSLGLQAIGQPFYKRPASYGPHDADTNKDKTIEVTTDGGSLTLNWISGNHRYTSVSGLYKADYDLQADSDGTPQQLLELDYFSEIDQWSQDFRISNINTETWTYTAGVYFAEESYNTHVDYDYLHGLEPLIPGFNPPAPGAVAPFSGFTQIQDYKQDRSTQALYGELGYAMTQKLNVTLGLRYTHDENTQKKVQTATGDYNRTPIIGLIPLTIPFDPNQFYPKQEFTDSEWTGTLKADYQLTDDTMAYASYSRGYRSGAFNGAAVNNVSELEPVDPEYVNAYEIGAKGHLFDNRLFFSTALFYYDYRNQQFLNVVGTSQVLDSASRAEVLGIDLELIGQVTESLSITAALGWLDTEYKDGPVLFAQGADVDLSGNQLINAPEHTANLAADYITTLGQIAVHAHIDMNYTSEQWFTAFNDKAKYDNIGQSGYTLINGRIGFELADFPIELALWGKNLTDKSFKTYAINLQDAFAYEYTIRGAPRTYGAEISYEF